MKNFLTFLILLLLCSPTFLYPQTAIRFLPQWLPQAQFAGYYMAKEKGIYEKYGLNVEILKGGPVSPSLEMINDEKADVISMFLSGGIKGRANGEDLVLFGQLSQRSALIFVARKSAGIHTLKDFNGRKIGIWRSDFQEIPVAFLKENNIDYQLIPITSTINLFLKGGIDIMCVMWYNEYHQILNAGVDEDELTVINFYDHNFNIPEDGLYCTNGFYKGNIEACQKFVDATLEGWLYAFQNVDESLDVVIRQMEEVRVPANKAHQRWMLSRMRDVIMPDGLMNNAVLKHEDYIRTAEILLDSETIQAIPDWNLFYKTRSDQ